MRKIGVIGFGGRLGDLIQNVLLELGMDVKIAAVADTDLTAVRGAAAPSRPDGPTASAFIRMHGKCWTTRNWTGA